MLLRPGPQQIRTFSKPYIFVYPDSCARSPATQPLLVSSHNAPRGKERCVTIKTTSVADYSVDASDFKNIRIRVDRA